MRVYESLSALALIISLLAGCAATGGAIAPTTAPSPKVEGSAHISLESAPLKPADILKDVYFLKVFNGDGEEIAQGSGFIAGKQIVTNAHVIAGAAWVNVYDSTNTLLSTAAYTTYVSIDDDLAILPFPSASNSGLSIRQDKPAIGDTIWAYGAPMGLQNTVTIGNISGYRDIDGRERMQISAPISSGSSGGPVVDTNGNVVGVVVATYKEGQNLNFAIPASRIPEISMLSSIPIPFPKENDFESKDAELTNAQYFVLYAAMVSSDVSYGQPVTHWYTSEDKIGGYFTKIYSFEGNAGDAIEFAAESAQNIDISLAIFDMNGLSNESPWLVEDNSSGLGKNPLVRTRLKESGPQFVAVISQNGNGSFTLYSENIPSSVAMPERWKLIYEDDEKEHYIDISTIKTGSQYGTFGNRMVTAWIYVNEFASPSASHGEASESMSLIEFDCNTDTLQLKEERQHVNGIWETTSGISRRVTAAPGTVAEVWMAQACGLAP